MKPLLFVGLISSLIMSVWMRGWLNQDIPLTPREENIPQLANIWRLKDSAEQGVLWTAWNPLTNSGAPNLIQRSYLLFAPLAQIAASFNISVDQVYKIAVAVAFILSSLGMYQLLITMGLKKSASLIGAVTYMLSPPHITLGSDLLDFNYYWALIPWLIYVVEHFIRKKTSLVHGATLGVLLTASLISGSAYFLATLPFLASYTLIRLVISRVKFKQLASFSVLTIGFFLTTGAFIIMPSAAEISHVWLSQETARRQIVDLPDPVNVAKLFLLRWQGYPATAWEMAGRYPDMSWYLGTVPLLLSTIAILNIKPLWRKTLPSLIIIGGLVPFFLIMRFPQIKLLVLKLLSIFPNIQAVFDHTFRLFLIPSFVVAILTGIGTHYLFKTQKKIWTHVGAGIILGLIVFDLYPLSAYFSSIPLPELTPSKSITQQVNRDQARTRFWSPFPYVRTLPRYRFEYATRFITKNRVNGEYLYTALAPRYTSEVFDRTLTGALEAQRQPLEKILHLLSWGNTKYIILHRPVFNYEPIIEKMSQHSWQEVHRSETFVLLENTTTTSFIQTYTRFQPVARQHQYDLEHWYQASLNHTPLYHGAVKQNSLLSGTAISPLQVSDWSRPKSNIIITQVKTSHPTLVVASESWYPGWQVKVDQESYPLVRANYAFLGVVIPPGNHDVQFVYVQPWYYLAGKIISITALLLLTFIIYHVSKRT